MSRCEDNGKIENLLINMWLKDEKSNIISANKSYCDTYNKDLIDLLNLNDLDFYRSGDLDEDTHQEYLVDAQKYILEDMQVIQSCKPIQVVEQLIGKNGERLWIETIKTPVVKQGKVVGTFGISHDITEKKLLEEQIKKKHTLEVVGEFAKIIAHDFNNYLTPIKVNNELMKLMIKDIFVKMESIKINNETTKDIIDLISEKLSINQKTYPDEETTSKISKILSDIFEHVTDFIREKYEEQLYKNTQTVLRAVSRAQDTVKEILEFSDDHKVKYKMIPTSVSNFLAEYLPLYIDNIALKTQSNIEFYDETDREYFVLFDHSKMDRALFNIVRNAQVALAKNIYVICCLYGKDKICIAMRDDGCGMKPETMERMFDPGFSEKPTFDGNSGSGLGLAYVKTIMTRHNAEIFVESNQFGPNKGTTFKFIFPIHDSHSKESDISITDKQTEVIYSKEKLVTEIISNLHEQAISDKKIIVVVDDEDDIRFLIALAIKKIGYQVIDFDNAEEALDYIKKHIKSISLVMTDFAMPKEDGIEFVGKLNDIDYNLKIIMCTGFSAINIEDKLKKVKIDQYITKPIDIKDIQKMIKNLLKV